MTMEVDPCAILEHKVSQRVHDDESHRLVTAALTEVAVAAMHPARHLGVGRSASRGMLEDSIENATQAAVEALVSQLEDLVEYLPILTDFPDPDVFGADHGASAVNDPTADPRPVHSWRRSRPR